MPNHELFVEKYSISMQTTPVSIGMTACARTINIASHSTVDGVPENSVQDCAQVFAMAIEHAKS